MLLNYQNFLLETYTRIKLSTARENFLKTLANVHLNESEQLYVNFIISEGLASEMFDMFESEENDALYESFFQKAKERYEKAKEYLKTKGKEFLQNASDATKQILKIGGNILKPLKMLLEKIKAWVKKLWELATSTGQKLSDEHREQIQKSIEAKVANKDKRNALKSETKNIGQMISIGRAYFLGDWPDSLDKAAINAATKDIDDDDKKNESTYISTVETYALTKISEDIQKGLEISFISEKLEKEVNEISESDILESSGGPKIQIPYISDIMNGLAHFPPFKYFHKIGDKIGKYANNGLSKTSYYLSKLTGNFEPVVFVVWGTLIAVINGFFWEYMAKSSLYEFVAETLGLSIPGLHALKLCIGYCGMALALYGIVESILGKHDEGHDSHDNHEKEKE